MGTKLLKIIENNEFSPLLIAYSNNKLIFSNPRTIPRIEDSPDRPALSGRSETPGVVGIIRVKWRNL